VMPKSFASSGPVTIASSEILAISFLSNIRNLKRIQTDGSRETRLSIPFSVVP
jgi:hypothetical protein